ncbi:MAG: peptidoglycan editing factor PgeF [Pseudomonadota bacterium]
MSDEILSPALSSLLSNESLISHGFFGRKGGASSGIYSSLNCGYGSNDEPLNVALNRAKVAANIGVADGQLVNPYQIHSALAQYIDEPFTSDSPKVDALVTKTNGLALAILTADCAPILFVDSAEGVIGAAHAGWQGALNGVIEATIDLMVKHGAHIENVKTAIGPCIAQSSYEVGAEYRNRFLDVDCDNARFFENAPSPNKYLFDLKAYCAMRLTNAGISQIDFLPHDTCAMEKDYFSNRRRTILGEADYGRNISVIAIM